MQVFIKQITNNQELKKFIAIRTKVFIEEQQIDPTIEMDGNDYITNEDVSYFGIYCNEELIGGCRLMTIDQGKKIQRFAILREYRNYGYGSLLLKELIKLYRNTDLHLHAQVQTVKYYERNGFKVIGPVEVIAGIKHLPMVHPKADNPFIYSNTNKRYHTLDYHFKEVFGQKVGRISINAGFTCPNIDGTAAFGGCTFCSTKGSGDYAGSPKSDLLKQWDHGKEMMSKKWPNAKFIAYFQAFTNTYAPLDVLKEKFETFANLDDCIGISIGTRPDCLEDDVIEYLADLSKRKYLLVELGLQTMHDKTSNIINRGHDLKCFEDALHKLRSHNINVIVHTINGLPGEDYNMMMQTHEYLAKQDIQGIKIHLLHAMTGTALVNQLNNGFLQLMDREEYINLVVDQLELFNPEVVIHRLTGDAPSENFIGPIWSKKKVTVLNDIDKEFVRRNTYQGAKYDLR